MLYARPALLVLSAFLLSCGCGVAGEWRWREKVAVVTGASSGIGADVAVALANRGVIVVALARRKEKLQGLLSLTNGTIHIMQCDLLKEDEVLKAFRWVEETLGGVDILINNAGMARMGPLTTGKTEDWSIVLNLNVLSLCVVTREALKSMRTRGDNGQIININSVLGHEIPRTARISMGIYPASKFAVTAITQTVNFELAQQKSKIKVSSLNPGLVSTEMTEAFLRGPTSVPFIEPSAITEGVVYILSAEPNVQIPELTIWGTGSTTCH